jgi:hypothetical protein
MKSDPAVIWRQVSGSRAHATHAGNYGLQSRRRNHTPVRPVRFLPGREVFAALDEADAANGQLDLDAIMSEPPASGADQTGRNRAAGGNARDESDTITFPHFEPDPNAPDEDATVAALPTLSRYSTDKPRRGPGLMRGLLLTLVVLQAGPTFLWLRARFPTFTTSPVAVADDTAPAAQPPAVAAPPDPARPRSNGPPPPRPVGTGSVASTKASPAASTGVLSTAASVASQKAVASLPAGALSVVAPVPMQVYAKGRLIGTTKAKTITLPVGTHDLDFVSEEVGYRAKRSVAVREAETTQVRLDAPMGMLSVNATPSAEVWIDNQRIGETPIGNFRVAIGRRRVLFRHPTLGDRRAIVLVTLTQPASISMDFGQK